MKTNKELQEELRTKLKECGFTNILQMVRNYSKNKHSLLRALEKVDKILESKKEGSR